MPTTTGGFNTEHATWEMPPIQVPNDHGGFYKIELVISRDSEEGTEKTLWWFEDDPRTQPHNHPWEFSSKILHGGYSEDRYWIEVDGSIGYERLTHVAGETNTVPVDVYHNVVDVLPGTTTRMTCGPVMGPWNYLDIHTGELIAVDDPRIIEEVGDFMGNLHALNPFLKK